MKTSRIINFILLCAIFILSSCEDNSPEQSSLITVMGESKVRPASADGGNHQGVAPVVFTGNDIAWFNSTTQEIKFRGSFNHEDLKLHQNLQFYLAGEHLFTALTYVQPIHSFAFNDLVLYVDADGRYYLHDCYPLSLMEILPGVKENKQKREAAWDKLINQLKSEKKLMK